MKSLRILCLVFVLNVLISIAYSKHGHGSINCKLPPESGPCKARITKYYYDNESRTCRTFVYGGCEGNTNNFRNKHNCMKYCARKRHGWLGTGWI